MNGQDTHSPRLGIAVFAHGLGLQSQPLKTGWDCSPSPKPVPQSSRDCSPSPRPVPQNARDCSPSPLTLSLKIAQNHKKILIILTTEGLGPREAMVRLLQSVN